MSYFRTHSLIGSDVEKFKWGNRVWKDMKGDPQGSHSFFILFTLSSVLRHLDVSPAYYLFLSWLLMLDQKSHTSLILQHHQWFRASSQSWAQTVPGESAAASAHSEELVSLPCPGTDNLELARFHFRGRRMNPMNLNIWDVFVNLKSSLLLAGILYCTVSRKRSRVNRTCKCSLSPLSSSFLIKFHLVSACF